ncbi:glycoside hydrolase family 76 protein [Paenibacillus harenae]|uniref:Alpha-1,6-mannanase (GH76 family) n=1 Tax=Paenibacillus harenae TaxID=306543 RepID=A0ABT9UCV6_PAEHA|nr:glycoside hydrolase family 76 protein [Paenibacillus harenae]MDQ0116049.1 putative alpha-1,6-mannanase (GH76 family) [Paenibacillus harenae]
MNQAEHGIWERRADEAQSALESLFWNESIGMYNIETPCPDGACNTIFHYWWMAHAADVLTDGFLRTGDASYAERLSVFFDGLLARNGGVWPNELYDDMEWMALAWLRAYQATGAVKYKEAALLLWEDIKTGWNEHMGGGIAWQKSQLDYKNTPANAPAAILAARLHRAFGSESDLAWALKIYEWQKANLVDPATGFVWDGMNRLGDGQIDKHWKFTYCQGVFIGAAVELYRITKDDRYLADASRSASASLAELAHPETMLLPDEETGDGGLFKGIYVRYLTELAIENREGERAVTDVLASNAKLLWEQGRGSDSVLFSPNWSAKPEGVVTLSVQLSAVKLLEAATRLSAAGLIGEEALA